MLLRNVWYVASFAGDVETGHPVGRKILDQPVVLFRTASGKAAALEDRCSHRAMPLSKGHVDGEIIRCCYHGVEFGVDGTCARIPNQARIPAAASIRSYPVVEKDSLIWIWMGDPALADPELIISNPEHSDPRWGWTHFNFRVEANWQLLVDNILDLTHVPYIHAQTIGGTPEQHFAAETKVQFDGRKVSLDRRMPNSVPPKTYVDAGGFKGRVDRWQEVRFEPGLGMVMRVNAGGCDAGTGAYEGKRDHGFTLVNVHCVTPESETVTHYMWSICTNAPAQTGAREILFEQFFKTISEDEVALAAQQQRIDDDPTRPFVGIASDGAVNQGRRVLEALHAAEQGASSAAA